MKLKKKTENNTNTATDLRSIMDMNRVFNIIYSGVEQESYFNILYNAGIRNFLMSFHYIQNRHLSMHQMYAGKGIKFFIDSGAHTYQQDPKYANLSEDYWEDHLKKYLAWAEKNKEYIFAIANFDFEEVVGAQVVREWNEKYFEPFMLRTGIPVCFVWHQNSYNDWDHYCKRYPYVGFSSVNTTNNEEISMQEYVARLRIAEQNNALVHGFGMTRTSMLTQLPFYTADSTTWLVGLQYGEVNYWNGQKMSRLKKDKWKGSMLNTLVSLGFNEDKLLDEDTEELIKVNIYAFMEAEKYIQTRLKSHMYWLRPKSVKRTEEDLENLEYPSPEWINSATETSPELDEYAKLLNVSLENRQDGLNCVIDMTCFMNWDNPDYAEVIEKMYKPETIKEIHDRFINRITENDEEKVSDLREFFKLNLTGESTILLYLNTNFDRIVKERDSYIEDDEYDLVDIPSTDLDNAMHKYLPATTEGDVAPEISELDDEIFKQEGIIAVRDEQGRFLKGQKKIHKPKKLYSEKYPKLSCDMCINAQRCPEYKAGYVCAYNKMFSRYNTRDMGDIIQAMQGIVDLSMQRLQRSMLTEIMQGGMPDPNVSNLMNQSMSMLRQLQSMYEYGSQEVLRQTKVVRADGSSETTTQVSNPQQGGILAQIFGNMTSDEPTSEGDTKDMKEVTPEEEEPKKSDS